MSGSGLNRSRSHLIEQTRLATDTLNPLLLRMNCDVALLLLAAKCQIHSSNPYLSILSLKFPSLIHDCLFMQIKAIFDMKNIVHI